MPAVNLRKLQLSNCSESSNVDRISYLGSKGNALGISPPKQFGGEDSLILHNYSSSNQIGASSSTQAMAVGELNNMSAGVLSRQ